MLHSEMMKYIHLGCSEAFDVQLRDCWRSEIVDCVPWHGHLPSGPLKELKSKRTFLLSRNNHRSCKTLLISINKRLWTPDEITVHREQHQPESSKLHIVALLLPLRMVLAVYVNNIIQANGCCIYYFRKLKSVARPYFYVFLLLKRFWWQQSPQYSAGGQSELSYVPVISLFFPVWAHARLACLSSDWATTSGRLPDSATCIPHEDGGIPLSALPKDTTSKLSDFNHTPTQLVAATRCTSSPSWIYLNDLLLRQKGHQTYISEGTPFSM